MFDGEAQSSNMTRWLPSGLLSFGCLPSGRLPVGLFAVWKCYCYVAGYANNVYVAR